MKDTFAFLFLPQVFNMHIYRMKLLKLETIFNLGLCNNKKKSSWRCEVYLMATYCHYGQDSPCGHLLGLDHELFNGV